jgi:hypothetical protein
MTTSIQKSHDSQRDAEVTDGSGETAVELAAVCRKDVVIGPGVQVAGRLWGLGRGHPARVRFEPRRYLETAPV